MASDATRIEQAIELESAVNKEELRLRTVELSVGESQKQFEIIFVKLVWKISSILKIPKFLISK